MVKFCTRHNYTGDYALGFAIPCIFIEIAKLNVRVQVECPSPRHCELEMLNRYTPQFCHLHVVDYYNIVLSVQQHCYWHAT
jgi:hypothetical protein